MTDKSLLTSSIRGIGTRIDLEKSLKRSGRLSAQTLELIKTQSDTKLKKSEVVWVGFPQEFSILSIPSQNK